MKNRKGGSGWRMTMSRDEAYKAAAKAYWHAYDCNPVDDDGAIEAAVDAAFVAVGFDPDKTYYEMRAIPESGLRYRTALAAQGILAVLADGRYLVEVGKEERMSDIQRYGLEGVFGTTAASNSTSHCRDCGAVVYDTEAHDRWHTKVDRTDGAELQEDTDGR